MKLLGIIIIFAGVALISTGIYSIPKQPKTTIQVSGFTDSEVRYAGHQKDIDSCLNVAITYTKAADILDPLVDVSDAGLRLRGVQIQYLDSAAKYKKQADKLILGKP